jgi:hypothetical protein
VPREKKHRTPIPDNISAEILYAHNRTCCVCNIPGLAIQIHHLDENPNNHSIDNLAVLCLEHHEQTQIRGGFGKKLKPADVKLFREKWLYRVKLTRDRADKIIEERTTFRKEIAFETKSEYTEEDILKLIGYLNSLPFLKRAAVAAAQPRWDSGISGQMISATYEITEIYENVLNTIASSFRSVATRNFLSRDYFNSYLIIRYRWHANLYEPSGPGSGGSLAREIVAA